MELYHRDRDQLARRTAGPKRIDLNRDLSESGSHYARDGWLDASLCSSRKSQMIVSLVVIREEW